MPEFNSYQENILQKSVEYFFFTKLIRANCKILKFQY